MSICDAGAFFGFTKRAAACVLCAAAVLLCFAFAASAQPPDRAAVTFRAEGNGTVTASVDGVPIASGDSVAVGKSVRFTAVPSPGYGNVRWWMNGKELYIADLSFGATVASAAPLDVAVLFERESPPRAGVAFRAEGGGTVEAAVEGAPIASGDSVAVGKEVVFTAVPDDWNGTVHWIVGGADIVNSSSEYVLTVRISTEAAVDVTASFEVYVVEPPVVDTPAVDTPSVEPPVEPLSGVLTFGPSPVRPGGEVAIFWAGNKAVGGGLAVFDALGDKVAVVNVSGVGKVGAWNTRGVARGTYLVKGMLKDKDGFKCRVLMLVGVVR